eukprot:CAMPEP_0170918594 /NCGR_PEP_ID=MMETSP0735-20130129/8082_1 /TAXON_ID=186038 /ORGANISM="Fragilariopsis kerguelensis, Strain L26-C5" /LENGTH=443 /DNA_ID=CAMNT_0011317115 /DNA_START=205 /DNA_END=1536 /DNA_ORIENTATION=-
MMLFSTTKTNVLRGVMLVTAVAAAVALLSTSVVSGEQDRGLKSEKSSKKDKKADKDKGGRCGTRFRSEEPELVDIKGNRLFRRKLIAREFLQDSDEGRIYKVTFKLCKDENELHFPDTDAYGPSYIDVGLGDYFRIAPTEEWWNYTGVSGGPRYSGIGNVLGTRAYSPVGPMQNNTVELIIKSDTNKYDYEKNSTIPKNGCVKDVNCQLGMSRLLSELPIGAHVLFTERPEMDFLAAYDVGYYANNINVKRGPDDGPYTINFIGMGIAPTEINIVALSELKSPRTKKVNILLGYSYWSNVDWAWTKTPSNDLYRELFQQQGKYGARLEINYAITREDRPESTLAQERIDIDTIQQAFNVTKKPYGTQDPNVKWLIVGDTRWKQKYYPMLVELGYELYPAPDDQYGIYYDGQNSLYTKLLRTDDPYVRDKSPLYQYYEELEEQK